MALEAVRYQTGTLSEPGELSIWRQNLSTIFETQPAEGPFRMSIEAYNLSSIVLGTITTVAQRYERSRRLIHKTGSDHYLIQVYRSGGCQGLNGHREFEIQPGDVSILDLSQVAESEAAQAEMFNLVIPRALLDQALGARLDLAGLVIPAQKGMASLLGDYFRCLERRLPTIHPSQLQTVIHTTVGLLAPCIQAEAQPSQSLQEEINCAHILRIKRFIAHNLADERLSPGWIADHFKLSRATLYRLFKGSGGVAGYIRSARLERAYRALLDPARAHLSIAEIAEAHGFACPAHFSRLFSQVFGLCPQAARQAAQQPAAAQALPPSLTTLDRWLRDLAT